MFKYDMIELTSMEMDMERPYREAPYIEDEAKIVKITDHDEAAVRERAADYLDGEVMSVKYEYHPDQIVIVNGIKYKVNEFLINRPPNFDFAITQVGVV